MDRAPYKDLRPVEPTGFHALCQLAQAQTESQKLGAIIDRINQLLDRNERKVADELGAEDPTLGKEGKRS
jgi:hypothetical protein